MIAASVILGGASHASADSHTVVLSTTAPPDAASVATRVTATILELAKKRSPSASIGAVSIDDLTLMAGCSFDDVSCRKNAVRSLRAKRLVDVRIEVTDNNAVAVITVVTDDGTIRSATSVDDSEASITAATTSVLDDQAPPPVIEPPVNTTDPDAAGTTTGTTETTNGSTVGTSGTGTSNPLVGGSAPQRDEPSGISKTTWAVLAGGGVALGTGVVFLVLASNKQSEIDDAPTDTLDDVRRLVDLEDSAKLRSGLGIGFASVGVVALAVGSYLVVRDKKRSRKRAPMVSVGPGGRVMVGFGGEL